MCSSAIMHSWLQCLAPHIAHWCPSNGKVDTQCRLQRLRVLNKSRFGLLSARVMFNHCSIAQCSCDPSCLLMKVRKAHSISHFSLARQVGSTTEWLARRHGSGPTTMSRNRSKNTNKLQPQTRAERTEKKRMGISFVDLK